MRSATVRAYLTENIRDTFTACQLDISFSRSIAMSICVSGAVNASRNTSCCVFYLCCPCCSSAACNLGRIETGMARRRCHFLILIIISLVARILRGDSGQTGPRRPPRSLIRRQRGSSSKPIPDPKPLDPNLPSMQHPKIPFPPLTHPTSPSSPVPASKTHPASPPAPHQQISETNQTASSAPPRPFSNTPKTARTAHPHSRRN